MNMNTSLPHAGTIGTTRTWKEHLAHPRLTELVQFEPGKQRSRILYVDDDAQIRTFCRLVLLRAGYNVDSASDGFAGWKALNNVRYGLLITDHDMPRMTGLELAANVRRAGMNIPIMMTSGSFDPMRDSTWELLESASFLPKPFAVETILSAVEQILHSDSSPSQRGGHVTMPGKLLSASSRVRPHSHGGINE
jgi:DNA-binding response OmpR family regulator